MPLVSTGKVEQRTEIMLQLMRNFWEERCYECVFRSFIVKERGEREERERKGREWKGR